MNELEHLRSMWTATSKRKTTLIVDLSYEGEEGSLNNDWWEFKVPYAFREALDIKYEERQKKLIPYWTWTQGPLLNFKIGDLIGSKDGSRAVKVESATPMQWDDSKQEMFEGNVTYSESSVSNGQYDTLRQETCTQMQFLELLIHGKYDG